MERRTALRLGFLLALTAILCVSPAVADEPPITAQAALGTGFTYQGRLTDGGVPANGAYDFVFRLYDGADPAVAAQVGADVALEDVSVTTGLFTVALDFGATPFNGQALWLQVSVRPGASGDAHTALSPTTALNAAPYALSLWPGAVIAGGLDNDAALEVRNSGVGVVTAAIVGHATNAAGISHGLLGISDSPDGYAVASHGGRNFFEGNVGIGILAGNPTNRLHVTASLTGTATIANHVALVENTQTTDSADVLALKIRTAAASTSNANNFITFFAAGDTILGRVESNAAHGITYASGSGDYAEWLSRLDPTEAIEPGDIVGVFAGKVSKATEGASQVLVVSSGAAVAANSPGEEQEAAYELVAFIGQVPVQVRGPVAAGDFIIPSGLSDGTGIAVAPGTITPEQFAQVVGQAWESSAEPGLKSVRVVVGLAQRDPTITRLLEQVQSQDARLAEIETRLARLEAE